jgi:hypothetical protein
MRGAVSDVRDLQQRLASNAPLYTELPALDEGSIKRVYFGFTFWQTLVIKPSDARNGRSATPAFLSANIHGP